MVATDRTGQQIGKYRLLRLLASSRFADVYLCSVNHQRQQRVLKLFHLYLFPDERQTFRDQAQGLVSLSHPNIVPVLDYGVEASDNAPWLVMAYVPGTTLRQRYPLGSRLPLSKIIPYVQQLAAALQYAHDRAIVHQNIKPENIFLGRDGELLLSDFAPPVVTLHPSIEHEGVATVNAMPPEQSRGDVLPASDVYALANLVYQWLTGERRVPENGADQEGLHQKLPALPPLVEDVLQTALQPDPERRFRSVKAFASALAQAYDESRGVLTGSLAAGNGGAHLPSTSAQKPPVQRGRVLVLVLCAILFFALGASSLIYFARNSNHHATTPVAARPARTPTHTVTPTLTTTRTPVVTPTATAQSTTAPTTSVQPTAAPAAAPTPIPTSAAAPTATGTTLFQADWKAQNWSGAADWSVSNNELVDDGSTKDKGAAPTILAPYTVNRADYAVVIRARVVSAVGGTPYICFDAGALRGSLDASGWHGYKVAICDGKIRLQNGNDNNVLQSIPYQPDYAWHTYRFEAQGPHLRFYIDDILKVQADDNSFPSGGRVGLKSFGTSLEVSDLKVIAL